MTGDSSQLRRAIYWVMAIITLSATTGRILNAELVYEPSAHRAEDGSSPPATTREWPRSRPKPMPTFSSNDRSRWAAVRALVDDHTFVIGQGTFDPGLARYRGGKGYETGIIDEDGWKTIDKVMHPETGAFYSTKPPLLTVVAAGEYWFLKQLFGWSIQQHTDRVVKTILFTINVIPLAIFLALFASLLERFAVSDYGKLFVFATACFGTFLPTFAVTLNNHTPAAFTALLAVYALLRTNQEPSSLWAAVSGFAAGLTASLELPAFSLAAMVGMVFLVRWWRRLFIFVPLMVTPIAVQLILNYVAIGEWTPVYSRFGTPWYEYPGSHWVKPDVGVVKHGIDWARMHESRLAYAFHVLIGHHGLFSLTPVWFLSLAGVVGRGRGWYRQSGPIWLYLVTALVSVAVIGFYLVKSDNYGGWTSGLRWLFWLTPLNLLVMIPAADAWMARHWGRIVALTFLAVSVLSAAYPSANPWRHPWIYRWLESQGIVQY